MSSLVSETFCMTRVSIMSDLFFKVILGGGRMYMTPKGTPDPEYPTSKSCKGDRRDERNLIDVWLKAQPVRHKDRTVLSVRTALYMKHPSDLGQLSFF